MLSSSNFSYPKKYKYESERKKKIHAIVPLLFQNSENLFLFQKPYFNKV